MPTKAAIRGARALRKLCPDLDLHAAAELIDAHADIPHLLDQLRRSCQRLTDVLAYIGNYPSQVHTRIFIRQCQRTIRRAE